MADSVRTMRYKNWMVTCFDVEHFAVPDEDPNFGYMVYQVEECPKTKRWHVQGYLELKRQTDFNTVKEMFSPANVHLEKRLGTRAQAIAYCKKTETRVADPVEFGEPGSKKQGQREDLEEARQEIIKCTSWEQVMRNTKISHIVARHMNWAREVFNTRPMELPLPDIELRKWQKRVLALLNGEPENRRIIWIWSHQSGTGKTTFFNYCSAKLDVLPGTDFTNTVYLYNGQRVVWFDRTRAESNNERSVAQFYSDIERWSNHALYVSTKYVPCRKYIQSHCVVTANTTPDESRLPGRFLLIEAKHAVEEVSSSEDEDLNADSRSEDLMEDNE